MRHRYLTRLVRLLTIFALLLGMQMAASMPIAASGAESMPMPMPASELPCKDCGKGAMPASQCASICCFVLIHSGEPLSAAPITPRLRPMLAQIPAGWSMPPETAPPRA
jgi:hypothetical protein